MFSHLPAYRKLTSGELITSKQVRVHQLVLQLGLRYADGLISGGNSRTLALLAVLRKVVQGYKPTVSSEFKAEFFKFLNHQIDFLIKCRPKSIGMGTAMSYLKAKVRLLPEGISADDAKSVLDQAIESFEEERIFFAHKIIANSGCALIAEQGDVILTYASSHVVEVTLKKAFDESKKFRVVIVDSRPKFEGRGLLERLVQHGISCDYVLLTGVSYVLKEVTKVFMGAAGLFSNGSVMSRLGTAVVAMMATSCNLPVIFCCETYKFGDRVQLDSITNNELGDPDELVPIQHGETSGADNTLMEWRDTPQLRLLNLTYDITPVNLVTMVITEVGNLPPTAVPVVIREYHKDLDCY